MKNNFCKVICVLATLGAVGGCGKSLDGQISICHKQSSDATANLLPVNEFQKREIESKEQGIFYRCMKDAGFKEQKGFDDKWMAIIKSNNPNASGQEWLNELNKIRSQAMRRDDTLYTLWEK